MSTTAPTLNGQVIGQAHYATRAILERVLASAGTSFTQSAALNAAAGSGEAIGRDQLVGRMTDGLKIDDAAALATIAELTDAKLLEPVPDDTSHLRLTEAGRTLNGRIRDAVDDITARLYGDLPAEDLAAAGRVLAVVTSRANAELAADR